MENQSTLGQQMLIQSMLQAHNEASNKKTKEEHLNDRNSISAANYEAVKQNSESFIERKSKDDTSKNQDANLEQEEEEEDIQLLKTDEKNVNNGNSENSEKNQNETKNRNVGKGILGIIIRKGIQQDINNSNNGNSHIQANTSKMKGLLSKFGRIQDPNIFKQALLNLKQNNQDLNIDPNKNNDEKVHPEKQYNKQQSRYIETEADEEEQEQKDSSDPSDFLNLHNKALLENMAAKIGQNLKDLDDQVIKQQYQFYEKEEKEIFGDNEDKRFKKAARHIQDVIYCRKSVHYIKDGTFIQKIYSFQTYPK